MKKIIFTYTLLAAVLSIIQPVFAQQQQNAAEWLTLRGNNNRDGRTNAKGHISSKPRLLETIDIGSAEAYVELLPRAGSTAAITYAEGKTDNPAAGTSLLTSWQAELTAPDQSESAAYLDLEGTGTYTLVSPSQSVKYARLFPGDKKYYRIEAYDGFDVTSNVNAETFVGIKVFETNTNNKVFEKRLAKKSFMQRPHITVADMNNDNNQDIVITSWEGVYVFNNKGDSIAGLSQLTKGWHRLRKRGYASIADVDGNGFKDIVIISSLPWHVDVIKNNGGKLAFGWTKIFDEHVETAKKISKPIMSSVNDFDNDGSVEILVNIFNFNDDQNWTAVLFNADDGSVKAQIKGVYVQSAADLTGNGKFVFFCTQTVGQSIPIRSTLKVMTLKNKEPVELLTVEQGEWNKPRIPNLEPTITSHLDGISRLAEDQVLCADMKEGKVFFIRTRTRDNKSLLQGYKMSGSGTVEKTNLQVTLPAGMYGEILRDRKDKANNTSLLLQVKMYGTPDAKISIAGATATNKGRYRSESSRITIPVVGDINRDGKPEIIVTNDVGEVLCLGKNAKGKTSVQWRVEGHGMIWQYSPVIDYGVAVDDLDGDGYKEVLVAGAGPVGAQLTAYTYRGEKMWTTDFPEIPCGDITLWDGNLAFYGTAKSGHGNTKDVIVTVQRGIAHGGQTYSLNGKTGEVRWKLDRLYADRGDHSSKPIDSGAGGYVFSTSDIDNDGVDEVMCGFGNILFFADSRSGDIKFKTFMRKLFTDRYDYPSHGYETFWMQQITPAAFTANGQLQLSCFNTSVAAGTILPDGKLTWCPEELPYNNRIWQCLANLEGNNKTWVVELATRSADNVPVLLVYDPVTGAFRENSVKALPGFFSSPRISMMPVTGDINADGKDEIIVNNKSGIHCFGSDLNMLWHYPESQCGPPVLADADGDGNVEIISTTGNGNVIILGK